jgi:hypothetical protein
MLDRHLRPKGRFIEEAFVVFRNGDDEWGNGARGKRKARPPACFTGSVMLYRQQKEATSAPSSNGRHACSKRHDAADVPMLAPSVPPGFPEHFPIRMPVRACAPFSCP